MGQTGLRYFQRKTGGKPVWSIGPALSLVVNDERPPSSINNYSEWFDLHQPASVLYVSFGSQASISASQTNELAMGLEASGKAFIWVARLPSGFDMAEKFRAEWLPDGFEERMNKQNRGLLIHKWAPQQDILLHKSTGAFLSHCGWNSALESMCAGILILEWPLAGEQFFNSHMLEKEVGVCYEIGDGNKAGIIKHDHIAKGINMVLGKTVTGEEMRRKAFQIREKLKDAITVGEGSRGSSVKAMDEFISIALLIDKKTNKV